MLLVRDAAVERMRATDFCQACHELKAAATLFCCER